MKPSVIFLSLFASCLLMGQELETVFRSVYPAIRGDSVRLPGRAAP